MPPRKLPQGHISVFDSDYENNFSIDPKTGRLFWQNKEVVARKTFDFTGINQVWGWLGAIALAFGGIGAAATGVVDVYKEFYSEPSVDNKSIASIAAATSSIATKLQALIDELKTLPPVDSASFEKMAAATTIIASNSTELLKKLEPPPRSDTPPAQALVYFESGKFALRAGSAAVLDEWIQFLKSHPSSRVEIQGHSDNTGDPEKNLALSVDRAAAIADKLRAQGILENQLSCKGYADAKPIGDNRTLAGQDRNRRVEFFSLPQWERVSEPCLGRTR